MPSDITLWIQSLKPVAMDAVFHIVDVDVGLIASCSNKSAVVAEGKLVYDAVSLMEAFLYNKLLQVNKLN